MGWSENTANIETDNPIIRCQRHFRQKKTTGPIQSLNTIHSFIQQIKGDSSFFLFLFILFFGVYFNYWQAHVHNYGQTFWTTPPKHQYWMKMAPNQMTCTWCQTPSLHYHIKTSQSLCKMHHKDNDKQCLKTRNIFSNTKSTLPWGPLKSTLCTNINVFCCEYRHRFSDFQNCLRLFLHTMP